MKVIDPKKKAKEVCESIHDSESKIATCTDEMTKTYQRTFDFKHENPMPYSALPKPLAKTIGAGFSIDLYDNEMGKVKLMDKDHAEKELKNAPAKVKQKIVKVTEEEPEETGEIELEV